MKIDEEIKERIMAYFENVAEKYSVAFPPLGYSVNCRAGTDYARDLFKTLDDAVEALLIRGDGFTLGASFQGGWSRGRTSGTGDIGEIISNTDLLNIVLNE